MGGTEGAARPDPERWLSEHGDLLWRYAVARVRRHDEAEELVQDTLTAALQARGRFRGESDVSTWLVAILQHKITDRLRRRKRERALGLLDGMFTEDGHWAHTPRRWPSNFAEGEPFWRDLEACLAELPPSIAEAFVLREVHRQSCEGVCAALRITARNLWVRLHRARLAMRRCLASKRWPKEERRW